MARDPAHPRDQPGSFWDERYEGEDYVFGHEPNVWMAANEALFEPGMTALLPGDGEGRNGVWLAERGLHVTTIDASPVGVGKARHLAAARGTGTRRSAPMISWFWHSCMSGLMIAPRCTGKSPIP